MEFALVLPMLLVLLLGIADFGRVFAAGIVLEASARDAAEIGALERLRTRPPSLADADYYASLRLVAGEAACAEARRLPTFDAGESCPPGPLDGGGASAWFVQACVHDGADPNCGAVPTGFATGPPPECSELHRPWSNTYQTGASYYVEVRVCYKFETFFNADLSLPFGAGLELGDIWLQRTRTFVVDCATANTPDQEVATCPNAP